MVLQHHGVPKTVAFVSPTKSNTSHSLRFPHLKKLQNTKRKDMFLNHHFSGWKTMNTNSDNNYSNYSTKNHTGLDSSHLSNVTSACFIITYINIYVNYIYPSCESWYICFKYPSSFLSNVVRPPWLYPQFAPRILQFFFKIRLERSVHDLIADRFADLPTAVATLTHLENPTTFLELKLFMILQDPKTTGLWKSDRVHLFMIVSWCL